MDLIVVIFGLGVGLLVGMTGIGGGSLMTPLLILVLGTQPLVAVGTDLAYAALTKTVGGWQHWRQRTVDLGLSMWLALGSIPGALGGVYVLEVLHRAYGDAFDQMLLRAVAAALIITGLATLARTVFVPNAGEREQEVADLRGGRRAAAVAIGLSVGFVLGVTSAGSGALIAIALIAVFRLTPHRVVGTDVFHAAILLWVAAAGHVVSGNVDYGLAANLLIGSVPGVWVGSRLSVEVPSGVLRVALGTILVAAGLGLLSKAGASIPGFVLVAVPLGLAGAMWALSAVRRRRTTDGAPLSPAD